MAHSVDDRISIVYIGNLPDMIRILTDSKKFMIKAVVCESKKRTLELEDVAQKANLSLFDVKNKAELESVLIKENISVAVMYDFGIIIPQTVIEQINIFNFHPGSLRTNRGSSPLNWAVLLGEKTTEMSLHKISAEIDMGELVSTSVCYLEYKDTPGTLRKKLEQRIPDMLTDLYEYLKGNRHGKLIEEGIYRRRIEEKDYTINPETDTLLQVNAKIHSQAAYQGAIGECNGEKIYIKCWGDFEKVFGSNDAAVI